MSNCYVPGTILSFWEFKIIKTPCLLELILCWEGHKEILDISRKVMKYEQRTQIIHIIIPIVLKHEKVSLLPHNNLNLKG